MPVLILLKPTLEFRQAVANALQQLKYLLKKPKRNFPHNSSFKFLSPESKNRHSTKY